MSASNTNTTTFSDSTTGLNGLFKDQFAPEIENLVPEHALLQGEGGLIKMIPQDKQPGEFYSIPTVLRSNQGVTYAGESGGVTTLKDSKPGLMKEAQVKGTEMVIRGQLSYAAIARAAEGGAKAFVKATAWLVEDLAKVAHTRLEIAALYGQDNLGIVEALASGSGPWVVTLTDASFAAGMWALLEGALFEVFDASGVKQGTSWIVEATGIDIVNRNITFTTFSAGAADTFSATDTIHFYGARTDSTTYSEMVGLKKQMTATTGTLFNIARTYALMQGNSVALSSTPLTKAGLISACMKAVDKGCMSRLVALVSTKTFAALHAENLALERFNKPGSGSEKAESGTEKIAYRSVNGPIDVICHPLVKNGDCFVINPEETIWVGSTKPTFEVPGTDGEYFKRLEGSTAVEIQNYSDLAVYMRAPARSVFISGIAN